MTHDQLTIQRQLLNHQGITTDLYFGHILNEIKNGEIVPIMNGWERSPWIMNFVTRQDKDMENADLRNFSLWWTKSEAESALQRVVKGRKIIEEAIKNSSELYSQF